MQRRKGSYQGGLKTTSKRNRKAVSQVLESACNATIEPLEDRVLLSSVGVNFEGGYSSSGGAAYPWAVQNKDGNAGPNSVSLGSGTTAHTISPSMPNWNNETGGSGTAGTVIDNSGATVPGMSVTWNAGGTWSAATNQPADANEELNTGFIYSNGDSQPISITVSGVPYKQYDVIVYTLNDSAGRVETTTLNGISLYGSSPDPKGSYGPGPSYLLDSNPATPYYYNQTTSTNVASPTANGDFVVFSLQGTGTTPSSFTLTASAGANGYVNGIEIVDDEVKQAPNAPVENPTQAQIQTVITSWQPVMGNVSYNIYREPGANQPWNQNNATKVANVPNGTTSYEDTPPDTTGATTYTYFVTAVSPLGVESLPPGAGQNGSPNPLAPPPAPSNLTDTLDTTAPAITLNWTDSKNTSGYVVQRSTDYGATWQTLNPGGTQLAQGTTSFIDTTVKQNQAYEYRVGSVNDSGNSSDLNVNPASWSNIVAEGWNIQGGGDGWANYTFNSVVGPNEKQDASTNPGGVFFSRIDPAINYTGGGGDTLPPIGAPANWFSNGGAGDNFSINFKGYVVFPNSGQWTFGDSSDDGIEVDITDPVTGSTTILDNNIKTYRGSPNTFTQDIGSPINVKAGQKYLMNVYFHEGGGGWNYLLGWKGPGVSNFTLVPTSAVYAPTLVNPIIPTQLDQVTKQSINTGNNLATINWTSIAADGYNIYRAPDVGGTPGTFAQIGTVQGTGTNQYADQTALNGQTYWYEIKGYTVQDGKTVEGPAPATLDSTLNHYKTIILAAPPATFNLNPGNWGQTATFGQQTVAGYIPVSITWQTATGATLYHVYRNTTNSTTGGTEITNGPTLHSSPVTGTGILDSTAQFGKTYYYYVVAQNAFGTTLDGNGTQMVNTNNGLRASFWNDQWWRSQASGAGNGATNVNPNAYLTGGDDPLSVYNRGVGITQGFQPDVVSFFNGVNMNYGSSSPVSGVQQTFNSATYTGLIHLNAGTNYTFGTDSDDDSFIWVNGQLAAAYPYGHGFSGNPSTTTLNVVTVPTTGDYPFVAAQSQGNGGAGQIAYWSTGGALSVIPSSAFTSPVMPAPTTPDSTTAALNLVPDSTTGRTASGRPGQTPTVTFTFVDNNVGNALDFVLERADASSNSVGTNWHIVGTASALGNLNSPSGNVIGSTLTILDTTALPGATYQYRLRSINFEGISGVSSVAPLTVTMPEAGVGIGLQSLGSDTSNAGTENQGLEAHYYNDQFFGSTVGRSQSTSSQQAVENFGPNEFGSAGDALLNNGLGESGNESSPPPNGIANSNPLGIQGREMSVVATGQIQINKPGTYTFISNTDDDGYLYINGQLVSRDPTGHGTRTPDPSNIFPIAISQADINKALANPNSHPYGTTAQVALFDLQFFLVQGNGGWAMNGFYKGPDTNNNIKPITLSSVNLYTQSNTLTAPIITGQTGPSAPSLQTKIGIQDTNTSEIRYVLERSTNTNFSDAIYVNQVGVQANAAGPSITTGGAPAGFDNSTGKTTSITDNVMIPGQTYYYRVRAENYDFVSPWAVVGGATPTAFTSAANMPAPTNVRAVQDGSQINISWSNNNVVQNGVDFLGNADSTTVSTSAGYDVQRSSDGGSTWSDLGTTLPNQNRFVDTTVAVGKSYLYKVQNLASTFKTTNGNVAVPASAYVNSGSVTMASPTQSLNTYGTSNHFNSISSLLSLNGGASIDSSGNLQLLSNGNSQARTALIKTGSTVDDVSNGWATTFDFNFSGNDAADGIAFLLEPQAYDSVGGSGGSFGVPGSSQIGNSLSVYFNLWQNVSQTGLMINTSRQNTLDVGSALGTNIFHQTSGGTTDTFRVALSYDAKQYKLNETITDLNNSKVFNTVYQIPENTVLKTSNVYAGFGGGTGGANTNATITDWSFTANNLPVLTINGTAAADNIYVMKDGTTPNQVDWWTSATPFTTKPTGTPTGTGTAGAPLGIHGLGGADNVTIDESNGDVLGSASTLDNLPGAGNTLNVNVIGTTGADTVTLDDTASKQVSINNNTLAITGTIAGLGYTDNGGNDTITTNGTVAKALNLGAGNDTVTKKGTAAMTITPGSGSINLSANAGTTTIAANTGTTGIRTVNFSNMAIGSGASVIAAANGKTNHANRSVLVVASKADNSGAAFTDSGTLDLTDNDMVLKGSTTAAAVANEATVSSLTSAAYDNAKWDKAGLTSSTAGASLAGGIDITALGYGQAKYFPQYSVAGKAFDGITYNATDVYVKYTYAGDTTLDGKVDGSDYNAIDSNIPVAAPNGTWALGDVNFDRAVSSTDYNIVDSNQGAGAHLFGDTSPQL